jgi:hypothetical protein
MIERHRLTSVRKLKFSLTSGEKRSKVRIGEMMLLPHQGYREQLLYTGKYTE